MRSPFPGIDPYLESQGLWPDFYVGFLAELRVAIAGQLPESYVARIDERMNLVEVPKEGARLIRPDVSVLRLRPVPERSAVGRTGGTLTLEPVTIPLKFLEEFREVYIEILHGPGRRLVAVLELLSPSNKSGNGRRDYLARRNGLMQNDVHIVELDFLIAGHRLPMDQLLPAGDYFAMVARADRRPDCDVFAWSVRDPLPVIPIPLLCPDPDVLVDLAPLFDFIYRGARYDLTIDYQAPLTLPLAPEDRAWAEELARAPSPR